MPNKPTFMLRPFTTGDAASLAAQANNALIAQYMTDAFPHPYTIENAEAFIKFATTDTPIHIFAIEVNGLAVGGIGVHPQTDVHSKSAELGYWLGEAYWGQGIITEAVLQMIDFAFNTYPISRLFARPFGNNKASQKVLEKTGFKLEATIEKNIFKNGEFQDELIYAIRR
jgi:[ribosomal protein S5]-alanine N-acetyltransferase